MALEEKEIRREAWKYYFVLLAWPAYLFFLPFAFARLGWWTVLLMVFPGVWLFTWVGYLMHECWHKYVPGIPHGLFYILYSWMLVTDPQIYRLLHGHHHAEVNTWDDREFHPLGKPGSKRLWRLHNAAEITAGVAFLVVSGLVQVPRLERYKAKYRISSTLLAIVMWAAIYGGLGWASVAVFKVRTGRVAAAYLLQFWLGSFVLHHSQLVEHGNLFVAGDWNVRNVKTRNLRYRTLAEKIFLFLTHHDSREHVLHHTQVRVYSRPFPGRIPLPENAVVISLRQYFGILGDMLAGRESAF
jgi:fatty acid desaturase